MINGLLALSLLGVSPVTAPAGAAPGAVTLLSGDKVVVSAAGGFRVEPPPGRKVRYLTKKRDGHLYVIPSDALPLIAADRLDERLFDVTGLLSSGYGDAGRTDVPLVTKGASAIAAAKGFRAGGLAAASVPKSEAAAAWKRLTAARGVQAGGKVWLDALVPYALDRSVAQIGAPQVWQKGWTGKGVTVAVLDSGYDATHPALKDVVKRYANFIGGPDGDTVGHGTHVASIVAGAGERYRGVAPEAELAVGKVGNEFGAPTSAILSGMEWAANEVNAKIVNVSLGGPDTPGLDPLEEAIGRISAEKGTLFVVAAGNSGTREPVGSPAGADAALAVAAVDRQDATADFSSRGPRSGDHAVKPEISAPGTGIVAAKAGGGHIAHSGTSMAAPHVAGAAAIVAQRHPGWSGQRIKAALTASAKPGAPLKEQGAGRVDLVAATGLPVVPEPSTLAVAHPWGDTGSRVTTRTITYTNTTGDDLTLELAAEGEVLKLPSTRLVVPGGGQSTLTVTLDATGKAPGDHPGAVTATAGGITVRTPASAYVEPESYDLTVTVIPRDDRAFVTTGAVYDAGTGQERLLYFDDRGSAKVRLPKGRWNVYADVYAFSAGGPAYSVTAHQQATIADGDARVSLDAGQAKEIRFTLDDPAAVRTPDRELTLVNGAWYIGWWDVAAFPLYVVPVRQPGLTYLTRSVWQKPGHRYDLVSRHTGGIPGNPAHDAKVSELSTTKATYRGESGQVTPGVAVAVAGGLTGFQLPSGPVPLPGVLIHHRTPGERWQPGVQAGTATLEGPASAPAARELWLAAVTGPAVAKGNGIRYGDAVGFSAAQLFSDGTGHTGWDEAATGALTLSKDGAQLARKEFTGCESGCELSATLPGQAGVYTLTAAARRPSPLSPRVESQWTFRSAHTAKAEELPLMTVRYTPAGLDDANRATQKVTPVPIRVERAPGAVRSLRLEVSHDDGATWKRVPVVRSGPGWTALVANPGSGGAVSLRAGVTADGGAGAVQTVIRAWAVK
ncbi:S8 family serine peptidase [Nonomuraea typhae]|uniref:S8 family serine peptidase n=1 Tax=Nonomuraea typhae TaxID=2603600 RepID=UPI0012F9DD36|nr:S8 family serine peptidase [Nonomuraea typhae]